jgi:hypothetical protein
MRKNSVSVAMLVAMAVCGVVQNASHAQGGVMMPEHAVAPALHAVPPSAATAPAVRTESRANDQSSLKNVNAMPVPSIRPKASGRVVHVQEYKNLGNLAPASAPAPVLREPAPMGMGGFVAPIPAQGLGAK